MFVVLNEVFGRVLEWMDVVVYVGMVGVLMVVIFDYVMGMLSGYVVFLDLDVNKMLKKILNEWGRYFKVCLFLLGI